MRCGHDGLTHLSPVQAHNAVALLRKVDEDARRVERYLGRLQPASPLLAEIREFLKSVQ